ncbi:hypothetical protein [Nocardia gipuzkoensis]|uniref:hypothetical protein n=1 Tax=Nocardia gipuzkoensis TaxID=2749991 RepID=UPI00237E20A6|nr:hypothetical protein [Nocardia gipuzkoensis]MDE1672655.1 hypothetical protein [Nocardia gipuzkoensis]
MTTTEPNGGAGAEGQEAAAETEETPSLVASRFLWDELDVDQARTLWEELTEWVNWLRESYQLASKIKPCWYRHRAVREELTALMASHKAVYYTDPDGRDVLREDLTAWHTQWYRSALEAIAKLLADCTQDNCAHIPHTPAVDPKMADFIDDDVRSRQKDAAVAPATSSPVISALEMETLLRAGRAKSENPGPDQRRRVFFDGAQWIQDPGPAGTWAPMTEG